MINVREFQALQTQLLKEGNERFELQEANQRLTSQVELLKREVAKKEYELTCAVVAQNLNTPERIQELVETNLALQEQVTALKNALNHAQLPSPSSSQSSEAQNGQDIQSLLCKLDAKEEELSAMRTECRMWEEQVIRLKFELQSERFNLQEMAKEQRLRAAQKPPMDMQAKPTAFASRTYTQELQEYKNLAMERAQYWKLAELSLDKVNADLIAVRKENRQLRDRLQRLEETNPDPKCDESNENNVSSSHNHNHKREIEEAWRQTEKAQNTLTSVMKEMDRLQKELDEVPIQRKIESRRVQGIIHDLKNELKAQSTRVEQLQSAVALYSPRNTRGIDLSRKKNAYSVH
ncbi:hypothetical protein THRCLA_05302 [Thraustotheca clavata]|uniref:Uncharacterized protein n=1 Tax=Thraustotheca clavata TaxID=74557 RepID=A0A1V9ZWH7_9STRA|nr:hypothetical protein THRCLA_05302 [Thraustotheca clavata]